MSAHSPDASVAAAEDPQWPAVFFSNPPDLIHSYRSLAGEATIPIGALLQRRNAPVGRAAAVERRKGDA